MASTSASTSTALPSVSAALDVARLGLGSTGSTEQEAVAESNITAEGAEAAAAGEEEEASAAEAYERTHVHGVYEAIAPHFSATRYKPWPAVAAFLDAQKLGSVGLDVGCGNGKYLGVNPGVYMVGSDRSSALVALAAAKRCGLQPQAVGSGKRGGSDDDATATTATAASGSTSSAAMNSMDNAAVARSVSDVLVADGLSLPFRDGSVDFVICVAVIHHMSTRQRRQEAVRSLLRCVKQPEAAGTPAETETGGGRVLVYVWALEQGSSRRGWDEGGEQDLLVPWVLKEPKTQKQQRQQQGQRKKGGGGGKGASQGKATAGTAAPTEAQTSSSGVSTGTGGHTADSVFHRYYHLYRKGELEEDVLAAGGAVVTSGYEKDNWWVVCAPASGAGATTS
ncbi:hypothetical protein QBC46DRAFT_275921 [Diplogelasinospora grovesii]|uniref:Methyltransferase type 11 domain-containing protein n=1 Tax=Diplogelasinospora grovesii TaxID=303347 RepID=A0AAN6NII9_9PEZI|nr:hypothetical protein QBC46DRAFT_275921 [Diplogelasinospora grovesii]